MLFLAQPLQSHLPKLSSADHVDIYIICLISVDDLFLNTFILRHFHFSLYLFINIVVAPRRPNHEPCPHGVVCHIKHK